MYDLPRLVHVTVSLLCELADEQQGSSCPWRFCNTHFTWNASFQSEFWKCLTRKAFWVKDIPHSLHRKGFFPVCIILCWLRWDELVKVFCHCRCVCSSSSHSEWPLHSQCSWGCPHHWKSPDAWEGPRRSGGSSHCPCLARVSQHSTACAVAVWTDWHLLQMDSAQRVTFHSPLWSNNLDTEKSWWVACRLSSDRQTDRRRDSIYY